MIFERYKLFTRVELANCKDVDVILDICSSLYSFAFALHSILKVGFRFNNGIFQTKSCNPQLQLFCWRFPSRMQVKNVYHVQILLSLFYFMFYLHFDCNIFMNAIFPTSYTSLRWIPRRPRTKPVTRSFDAFFDQRPNKRLGKQSWGWWFETHSPPLWRHINVLYCYVTPIVLK